MRSRQFFLHAKRTRCVVLMLALCSSLLAFPAHATFHLMQIEQVIGGVNGDASAQAIQLRMRSGGQNLVQSSRLVAFDAAGLNPVVVSTPDTSVPQSTGGSRVLIASTNFAAMTSPSAVPDFTMDNLIPASYLAAGSLTFENSSGSIVYWRLSWGGFSYTGSTTGSTTNDSDGEFGPAFQGALPSSDFQALLFGGTSSAPSTSNSQDYALTSGNAVFTNNAGDTFTVDGATDASTIPRVAVLYPGYPNPFNARTTLAFEIPRTGRVRLQVFTVHGRLVDTLIDDVLPAGRRIWVWDGLDHDRRALSSGTYVVRLVTPTVTTARTITLLK